MSTRGYDISLWERQQEERAAQRKGDIDLIELEKCPFRDAMLRRG